MDRRIDLSLTIFKNYEVYTAFVVGGNRLRSLVVVQFEIHRGSNRLRPVGN
jgi:mRNA-degrading endonuclease HigB of HigAB toxin-antitoxin module